MGDLPVPPQVLNESPATPRGQVIHYGVPAGEGHLLQAGTERANTCGLNLTPHTDHTSFNHAAHCCMSSRMA